MDIKLLIAGALCALAVASAQDQPTYESVYHFAKSRGDLSIYSMGVDLFPDIVARFADPSLTITTFVPTDQAIKADMAWYYGLSAPLSTYDAMKIMLRNNDFLYPAVRSAPSPVSGLSGRAQISQLWHVIQEHALELPGAHMIEDLAEDQWYPTALPLAVQGLPPQQIKIHPGRKSVETYLIPNANITEANIRAGNSIIHVLDGVLWPNLTSLFLSPFDSINGIFNLPTVDDTTMFPKIMDCAAKAGKSGIDIENSKAPLTIFVPTDSAVAAFLDRIGMSSKNLLSSPKRCTKFIKGHSIGPNAANGHALFLLDLITLAIDIDLSKDVLPAANPLYLPGLDGQPREIYIYNLLNKQLNTTTPITEFTKGATHVGFGGPMGQILPLVHFGGTPALKKGVQSILHKVDAVLMDSLE